MATPEGSILLYHERQVSLFVQPSGSSYLSMQEDAPPPALHIDPTPVLLHTDPRAPGSVAGLRSRWYLDSCAEPAKSQHSLGKRSLTHLHSDSVQESALCAVHAINSLLQGPYFSAQDLAEVQAFPPPIAPFVSSGFDCWLRPWM